MNPLLIADFYKIGHIDQYAHGVTRVWSNWTPRSSRIEGVDRVIHFGLQSFLLEMVDTFNKQFFNRSRNEVVGEYRDTIKATLGSCRTDHIEALHDLGYIPLKIYAIPEGFDTPIGVPSMVITNTRPEFFWLTNFVESWMSAELWKPSTAATIAREFRKLCIKYSKQFGNTDMSFVDWQCHDFSMRGMSGVHDAALTGMGHLLSFKGTDTIPAILKAKRDYMADIREVGGSVPATEHSVMCSYGDQNEQETFRHLIEDVYPKGVVSIVSDTWDLWQVLTKFIPNLKDKIMARDGKLVIRPDSGDPVEIVCGKQFHNGNASENKGVIRLLAETMGSDDDGMINKAGCIYGDSINLDRCNRILDRVVNEIGLNPYNMVFGVGSYTYQYQTRDTFGYALKATAIEQYNTIVPIFKAPKTDSGMKKSRKGITAVYRTTYSTDKRPEYFCVDNADEEQLDNCALEVVFDGGITKYEKFETIRERVQNSVQ